MAKQNIKLIIEYDGTAYAGWQIQANQRTVQGEITTAIEKTTGQQVSLTGAGRTDAGVHALGQTANFMIDHHIEPERYSHALNFYLDNDIRIKSSEMVHESFHARYDALKRRYRYLIGFERSALYRQQRWEIERHLDFGFLKKAAEYIVGEYDFTPFCVTASRKENNMCHVHSATWRRIGLLLVFEIRGNRFLHSMVRSLVGAMVNVASRERDDHPENLTLQSFADIIQAPTNQRVVFTAPAHGLYLVSVQY